MTNIKNIKKTFQIEDAETGNWKLDKFASFKEAYIHVLTDVDIEEIPLCIRDLETDECIFYTNMGFVTDDPKYFEEVKNVDISKYPCHD